ncbi:carbohydrate kinase family protein [Tissierella sp. MB52-C2]|uniref:carbohydrate kinase family protein n=1 Tax=Tissierella sp. MB52-C2 TaxID=3070999 RepID=UPI00280A8C18|nr:carbohydrate kinase family protein [Tissierella sp. MB52-C2]WMM25891.1 carbohydrate kinase family protein [Tissierella sp. MB52-C2]
MEKQYVTVIGGANIDITGTPHYDLNINDSNPGQTILSLGGVGRNIAENLSRLNVNVKFITVLGDDGYSREITNNCEELNISLEHSLIMTNERTSTYLCINDESGEMKVAISDMEIYKYITPGYLKEKLGVINNGKVCVVDTNIPEDSLKYLMDNCNVPIFLDTVSTKKTEKIKDSIHNIYTLKPNIIEAEILSNMKINTIEDLEKATDIILEKGVERLFVSLGAKGVYFTDGNHRGNILPIETKVINTTGAGDSYIAAVIWAYLKGFDLEKSAKAGLSASYICINSSSTVAKNISEEQIINLMENNWR